LFIDARTLPLDPAVLSSDVCIIGSGPAGLTLAQELSQAGVAVNVLEAGGLEPDSAAQRLASGVSVGLPYYPLDAARLRQFGGTSGHWWSGIRLRPLEREDFEPRSWIPFSGWPFPKKRLDPFYERAQRVFGFDQCDYRLEDWLAPGESWLMLEDGPVRTEVCQFAGADVLDYYKRRTLDSPDVRVYLNANVTELLSEDSTGAISGVRVATLDGTTFKAVARVYVLAAGGIANPRLMLLSRSKSAAGIGNQNDLVGRFFMEHVNVITGRIIPSRAEFARQLGPFVRHVRNGVELAATLAIDPAASAAEQIGHAWIVVEPDDEVVSSRGAIAVRELVGSLRHYQHLQGGLRAELSKVVKDPEHRQSMLNDLGHLRHVARDLPAVSRTAGLWLTGRYRKNPTLLQMRFMAEQVPNPESRITLSHDVDALGLNKAQLDWQLMDLDLETIKKSQRIVDSTLRGKGLGRVDSFYEEDDPPPRISGTWHHLGTTRMHEDPKQGVVDSQSRVHGVSNLFVTGGSVFPTGGYANPTLTIVAMALRLADHLKKELAPTKVDVQSNR
jgi:choline dehydrogenase-like flavoprotein